MKEFVYEVIERENSPTIIKKTDTNGAIWWIPVDPANSDYATYLESLNDDTEAE